MLLIICFECCCVLLKTYRLTFCLLACPLFFFSMVLCDCDLYCCVVREADFEESNVLLLP